MKQRTNGIGDSIWNTAGSLCFLFLLPAAGVTVGIFISFWRDGNSWMPAFSTTGQTAACFVMVFAMAIFQLSHRLTGALRPAFVVMAIGAVAISLMTGICLNILRYPADPIPDDLAAFITAGMYLGGAACFMSIVMVIDAFFSCRPRSAGRHTHHTHR